MNVKESSTPPVVQVHQNIGTQKLSQKQHSYVVRTKLLTYKHGTKSHHRGRPPTPPLYDGEERDRSGGDEEIRRRAEQSVGQVRASLLRGSPQPSHEARPQPLRARGHGPRQASAAVHRGFSG